MEASHKTHRIQKSLIMKPSTTGARERRNHSPKLFAEGAARGSKMKRLVLHFDINGTITAVDTTEPGSAIENANMVISKSVFGKAPAGMWQLNQDMHDEQDSVSYYDYLKSQGVADYKRRSFLFTHCGHPGEGLAPLVAEVATSTKSFLFPSFVRTISAFPEALIVIRTFGQDVDDVLKTLLEIPSVAPRFRSVVRATPVDTEGIMVGETLHTYDEFNQVLETIESHILIQENYHYWNSNQRKKEHGKQLLGSSNLFQVFFDDNDCVHVRGQAATQTHFIRVNTMQALFDDDYFVKIVHKLLGNNKCIACGQWTQTITCQICQLTFCAACKESELHTGSFVCQSCGKTQCNTYKYPEDNCWFCKTRQLAYRLKTAVSNAQKILMGHNDEYAEYADAVLESLHDIQHGPPKEKEEDEEVLTLEPVQQQQHQ